MNTPYVRKGMGERGTERLVLRRLQAQRLLGLVHRRRVAVRHRQQRRPAGRALLSRCHSGVASMASNATLSTQACTSRARARPATRPHNNHQSSRSPCPSPAARARRRRPGRPWSRRRSRAEPRARRARASACQPSARRTRGRRRPSIRATATGAAGAYLKPSRRRAGRRRRRTSRTRRALLGRARI